MQGMNFKSIPFDSIEKYVVDPRYAFEQKLDGTRALISTGNRGNGYGVTVYSRAGTPLKHTAATQHLPDILNSVPGYPDDQMEMVLDGELMFDTGVFHVFDMPRFRGWASKTIIRPDLAFAVRRQALESVLTGKLGPRVKIVDSVIREKSKRKLIEDIRASNGEGLVIKDRMAPYEPGVRAVHSFKAKIVRTVDVVVMDVNRPDPKHGSISFGLFNGPADLKFLSNCSAIGKPHVEPGDVIEVAYLAWTEGGGLREPRMVRVREDKKAEECTFDQLTEYSKAVV